VADSCEHGNEPSGSFQGGDFLDCVLLASQGGFCPMDFVQTVYNIHIYAFLKMFEMQCGWPCCICHRLAR
jgi:hypothetical protein